MKSSPSGNSQRDDGNRSRGGEGGGKKEDVGEGLQTRTADQDLLLAERNTLPVLHE